MHTECFHCVSNVLSAVTHVVQVDPGFEQSMLYNEMYTTTKPTESELAFM